MWKPMNLNIRYYLIFIIFFSSFVYAEKGLGKILRSAIIENGFKSPEYMYINEHENLAPEGEIFFKSNHLSLNGSISCATCHISKKGSSDGIPNAAGVRGLGEGRERLLSGAKIVPRNTLALWGVGSKDFNTFFWDGRVDFGSIKIISQFGSQIPSHDPLITAVHLPVVEIRETLEEDDFVLAHKQESLSGAKSVYKAIVKNLITHEQEAIENLANKIGVDIKDIKFLDIATSIAAFIRAEFKIKNTGDGSLIITHATASCGCTKLDFPKDIIEEGGTEIIKITFDSKGKLGKQTKKITLVTNANPSIKILTITGEVISSKN